MKMNPFEFSTVALHTIAETLGLCTVDCGIMIPIRLGSPRQLLLHAKISLIHAITNNFIYAIMYVHHVFHAFPLEYEATGLSWGKAYSSPCQSKTRKVLQKAPKQNTICQWVSMADCE